MSFCLILRWCFILTWIVERRTSSFCLFWSVLFSAAGYTCDSGSNPCRPFFSIFYYPHINPFKFVRCGLFGDCQVRQCILGFLWNHSLSRCTRYWTKLQHSLTTRIPKNSGRTVFFVVLQRTYTAMSTVLNIYENWTWINDILIVFNNIWLQQYLKWKCFPLVLWGHNQNVLGVRSYDLRDISSDSRNRQLCLNPNIKLYINGKRRRSFWSSCAGDSWITY